MIINLELEWENIQRFGTDHSFSDTLYKQINNVVVKYFVNEAISLAPWMEDITRQLLGKTLQFSSFPGHYKSHINTHNWLIKKL